MEPNRDVGRKRVSAPTGSIRPAIPRRASVGVRLSRACEPGRLDRCCRSVLEDGIIGSSSCPASVAVAPTAHPRPRAAVRRRRVGPSPTAPGRNTRPRRPVLCSMAVTTPALITTPDEGGLRLERSLTALSAGESTSGRKRSYPRMQSDSAAPDGTAITASEPQASRDNVRCRGTHDECSRSLRASCAPARKALALLGRLVRVGLAAGEWGICGRTGRPPTTSEPDRTAVIVPMPGISLPLNRRRCAMPRRSLRVIDPSTIRPGRLPQPIRRLLLLTHPRNLEPPGLDLLPHQGEANSFPLDAAPGTADEHVDVGHAESQPT